MIYIFESHLSEKKLICFALRSIYGLGKTKTFFLLKMLGFLNNLKISDLTKEQIKKLMKLIESLEFQLASDLKKIKLLKNKKLIDIKSYRGIRKIRGLPVRGQRTHTNAKTVKKRF